MMHWIHKERVYCLQSTHTLAASNRDVQDQDREENH